MRKRVSSAFLRRGVGTEQADIFEDKTKTEKHPIYQTLVAAKKRKIIRQEKLTRSTMRYVKVRNAVIEKLHSEKEHNEEGVLQLMSGLFSYNILDNPKYQAMF